MTGPNWITLPGGPLVRFAVSAALCRTGQDLSRSCQGPRISCLVEEAEHAQLTAAAHFTRAFTANP